jgi:ABC-type iron transport system FetAB ATPase subunit
MASQNQYGVFKAMYDEESARWKDLMDRAKTYISLVTLFSGLLIFKGSDVTEYLGAALQVRVPFVLGAALFIGSLIAIVLSTTVREYEGSGDPERIINELPEDEVMTDEAFFDDRIAELAAATANNAQQNERLARGLHITSWLLIAGTSCIFIAFIAKVL